MAPITPQCPSHRALQRLKITPQDSARDLHTGDMQGLGAELGLAVVTRPGTSHPPAGCCFPLMLGHRTALRPPDPCVGTSLPILRAGSTAPGGVVREGLPGLSVPSVTLGDNMWGS